MHRRPRKTDDSTSYYAGAASPQTRTAKGHDPNSEEVRRLSGEPSTITMKMGGLVVGTYYFTWGNVPLDLLADMVMAYNEKYRG